MILATLLALAVQEPPFQCNRNGTTPEINACFAEDLAREETRMERYLDAARSRARDGDAGSAQLEYGRTQQTAWLDASQRAWTAYAAIRCDGVYD